MAKKINFSHLPTIKIPIITTIAAVAVFIFWQAGHFYVATEEVEAQIKDNKYTVESQENVLDESTEEIIEEDIEKLSIEIDDEKEQQTEKSSDITVEKMENKISSPAIATFGTAVKHAENNLRIGFITDLHASSEYINGKRKLNSVFIDKVNYFLRQMNDKLGPDMLIVNGDIIEGTKIAYSQGIDEIRLIKELFNQTSIEKYWVIGNHDLRSVQKVQWKKALDIDYTHKSFNLRGYKIIILDSNFDVEGNDVFPGNSYTRGRVSEKEMSWLKKELSSNEKKIIFMHHPPLRGIDSAPNINLLKNANELRSLFSNGNVLAVFSGHIEDLYSEDIEGVKYFVFPGIIKNPNYQGSFFVIDADKDEIKVQMSYIGKDRKYKTIDIENRK